MRCPRVTSRPGKAAVLLALSAFVFCSLPAFANDFMGELMAPPGASQGVRVRNEFRQYGSAGANQESFELRQNRFDLSAPLAKTENGSWRARAFAEYDELKTRARFSDGRALPNQLWDAGAGFSHSRVVQGDRTAGGNFTVSSASDRPFGAGRDFGFSLNLTYKIPAENEAAWILFLSLSNTRGFLNYVPLPGAAYSFKAHERVRMVLGIPFALIFWRPTDLWTVTFSYFPIRTGELRLSYGSPRGPHPYVLASFKSRTFRLYERADKEERLFVDEGLFQAGFNLPVAGKVYAELGGGLAFARRFFLARKVTEHTNAPKIRAENAPFGHLKLMANF